MRCIRVYNESPKGTEAVGRLWRQDGGWCFQYDQAWLESGVRLKMGPDLPLSSEVFRSVDLFISFEDRLPSRSNPAYPDYCRMRGINPEEQDKLVLLATLGRRGPSSFVFRAEAMAVFKHPPKAA